MDPQVAYICGNLFFAELVEAVQPMVMAGTCLAIYYSPFTDNCRFFTFMNSISEEAFLLGMKFVLIEAVIQLIVSIFLFLFLIKQLKVDVFRVGAHILNKNLFHFWCMSFFCCLYFLAGFLPHLGSDSKFEFEWLFGNVTNYVPLDAEEGMCQLFNIIDTADDGECAWRLMTSEGELC